MAWQRCKIIQLHSPERVGRQRERHEAQALHLITMREQFPHWADTYGDGLARVYEFRARR